MVNIFQILKYQISFKILKELVIDAYDQFLKGGGHSGTNSGKWDDITT